MLRLRCNKGQTRVGFGANGSYVGVDGTGGGGGGPGGGPGGDPGGGGGNPGGNGAIIRAIFQNGGAAGGVVLHFDRPVFSTPVAPDNSILINGVPLGTLGYTSDGYGFFAYGGGPIVAGMVWTLTQQPNWAVTPFYFPQSGLTRAGDL